MAGKGSVTCAKCGVTSKENPSLTFHGFPLPSVSSSLKAKVWAIYCYPKDDWTSNQSLIKLYKQNKMKLCSKHFDDSAFTCSERKKLNKFAIPTDARNILAELQNEQCLSPTGTSVAQTVLENSCRMRKRRQRLKQQTTLSKKHPHLKREAAIETDVEEHTSANIIIQDTETSSVKREDSTVEFVEDLDDVSMSDKCDDHDDDVRPDVEHLHIKQPVPTTNDNNTSYWKRLLSYILHNTQFCGICLCTEDNMNTVNDTFEIFVGGRSDSKTVLEILDVVFKEDDDILSNSQICNSCTKNLIQSYMFIQRAKETSRMLNCHLRDLYNKSCNISNNILNNEKQPEHVFITLENYDDKHHLYNPVHIAQEAKKSEVISIIETEKQKPNYKCSICNLFLPSYDTWRLHENVCIDTRNKEDLSRLRQVRKICKLCRRVIQIGGLAEHMTKYHKHAMTRSPRNTTIVSGSDSKTHIIEKPGSKDSKCITCLKSYKEEELEQQPCRFCCAKCSKASCLHYKYLNWHRKQLSKGDLRAKCLHCEYVCKSEEALLNHVNRWHVKHLSKIAIKSEISD